MQNSPKCQDPNHHNQVIDHICLDKTCLLNKGICVLCIETH